MHMCSHLLYSVVLNLGCQSYVPILLVWRQYISRPESAEKSLVQQALTNQLKVALTSPVACTVCESSVRFLIVSQ